MLEEYLKKTEPEYYPPVENLLDLIYEHYTENNPVEKNTVAGKAAKEKEKELEILPKSYTNMPDLWAYYDKVYFKKFSTKEIQENLTQYRRLV